MRNVIYIAILFLFSTLSVGQTVQKLDSETMKQFVERNKPNNSALNLGVIEKKWNSNTVLLAFYDQTYKLSKESDTEHQDYHRIIATLFFREGKNNYRKILIDTIDSEGGDPKIETVFFANADKDLEQEIVIIASWEQRHYDFGGTLYRTLIFDNVLSDDKKKMNYIKNISEKLDGGCQCDYRDGTSKKAKFKTEDDIKSELIKLGFKQ